MKKFTKYLSIVFIVIMLIVTYAPIMILVVYSFTPSLSIGLWNGFSLSLYVDMFTNEEIMTALGNSLLIGLLASFIATLVGTLGAVGLFYLRKLPKIMMNTVTQITMVNADIVTGLSLFLFFLVIKIIPSGYATLIIAHSVICTPYVIMSVLPRLSQLNPNVYEAGLDLGANHMRTFFTVVMPQLVSGMIAGFVLAFTISFDDFTIAKFIRGDVSTIPTYLYDNMKRGIKPVLRALSTVLLLSILAALTIVNIVQSKRNKKIKKML